MEEGGLGKEIFGAENGLNNMRVWKEKLRNWLGPV
jgi:hypothetical protein